MCTAQKMKFSIKDFFFSKCEQIRRKLADLVTFNKEKSLTENFIFCAVMKGYQALVTLSDITLHWDF